MNKTLRRMVFVALYVALAIVLDMIKEMLPFLNMPQGGSINIALIPIVVASFHLGFPYGVLSGLLWWGITSLMGLNEWFLNVPQYIVDYILPSAVIGFAGLFYHKKTIVEMELGIVFAMIMRTLALVLSGVYFWPDGVAAGSPAAWTASLAYNLPYCIATMVMLMVVTPVIVRTLRLDRR